MRYEPGARPCVGCGFCCLKAPCTLSMGKFGERRCPALKWNEERYICELASDHWEGLHIGAGCCCALNTWRLDVRNRDEERMEEW